MCLGGLQPPPAPPPALAAPPASNSPGWGWGLWRGGYGELGGLQGAEEALDGDRGCATAPGAGPARLRVPTPPVARVALGGLGAGCE